MKQMEWSNTVGRFSSSIRFVLSRGLSIQTKGFLLRSNKDIFEVRAAAKIIWWTQLNASAQFEQIQNQRNKRTYLFYDSLPVISLSIFAF